MADGLTHPDEVFNAARRLADPSDRSAYLEQACAGDPARRRQVDALLRAYEAAGSFLESPAAPDLGFGATLDQPAAPLREGPGLVIGPYKLLEQIGEGGMGIVFLAEQARPVQRRVALKVIKAGMDTRQVIARFGAERQALAMMDHPNIARVLDAGATDTGRPYFVMELVKGVPITRYCDEQRLTPRDRLGLFVQVCQAVQHAHQKGVIHRDLKPTNVLVALYDGKPVPKVIDFGVAKATGGRLTEATVFTGFGSVVGTPEYMSPEQAQLNQLDIDTRSDVYSLGVILYELLTGSTPVERGRFKQAAMLEMLRVVREEEPPRPSTRLSTTDQLASIAACRGLEPKKLGRVVRGELDWIVMRCLEKDRTRRYDTANGLALDVERYLSDEPVLACPPSAGYRFRKFARRNRAALLAGCVAVLVLLGGVAGLAVSNLLIAREKENVVREKERGDRHLARVQTVLQQYLANTAKDRRLKAAGLHDLRRALLLSMVAILNEFAEQEGDDRAIREYRGWALLTLGNIWNEIGETDKSLASYDQARATWDRLAADFPDAPEGRVYRAKCDNNRGIVLVDLHRFDEAEQAIRQALETREQLAQEYPTVADYPSGIGSALDVLFRVERRRQNKDAERRLLERAIAHQETAVRLDPTHREARTFLANHHGNLGVVLMEMNQPSESATAIDAARGLFEKLSADYPDDPDYRFGVAGSWNNFGNLYKRDRPVEALKAYRQAAAVEDKLAAEYPAVPDYRRALAGAHQNIELLSSALGRTEEADAAFAAVLAIREQLIKEHPGGIDDSKELANSLIGRGCKSADAGRFEAALGPLTRAVAVLGPLAAPGRDIGGVGDLLLRAHGARADALLRLGRHAEAVVDYDRALALDGGEQRSYFRIERAIALAYLKEHARAAAEVDAVAEEKNLPAFLIQDAAAAFAVCSAAVRDDATRSEQYAARAVALLRRAFEKNYKAVAADVRRDKNLDALRSRDDYKTLLTEWEARPKK